MSAPLSGVQSLVVSDRFSCALLNDHRVACWGKFKALADLERPQFRGVRTLPDVEGVRGIYASAKHLVVWNEDGTGQVFGATFDYSDQSDGSAPLPALPSGTTELAIGDSVGCALTEGGDV